MNNILKNILLFVVVLVLSYFTTDYFGSVYDYFTLGSLGDTAWISTTSAWQSIIGFPFAYIFFTALLSKLFGSGNINKWIGWLLVLPFLFFASGDLKHIYLPIIIGLIAFSLATLLRKIFKIGKYTDSSPR